jgi:hypothetical protein
VLLGLRVIARQAASGSTQVEDDPPTVANCRAGGAVNQCVLRSLAATASKLPLYDKVSADPPENAGMFGAIPARKSHP